MSFPPGRNHPRAGIGVLIASSASHLSFLPLTTKVFSYVSSTNSRRKVLFGKGLVLYDFSTHSRETPVESIRVRRHLCREGDKVTRETDVKQSKRDAQSRRHKNPT